jgi:hypothetical protein
MGIACSYKAARDHRIKAAERAFSQLRATYAESQGYGTDPLSPDIPLHFPMAYGLIASAEARRYLDSGDSTALSLAVANADWLVANRDRDQNERVGWGLPVDWDAFNDGTVNPAHTEYGITTALVVMGLLDTVDALDTMIVEQGDCCGYAVKRQEYVQVSQQALSPYMDEHFYNDYGAQGLCFWYSTRLEDAFDVHNINSMMSGMLQRLSTYTEDADFAQRARAYARQGIQYTINSIRTDGAYGEGYYWSYYGQTYPASFTLKRATRPNDLVHAIYTYDGLLIFREYGGEFPALVDHNKLTAHFHSFVNMEQHIVTRWPDRENAPRLWSVGYALYFFSKIGDKTLAESAFDHLQAAYRRSDGHYNYLPDDNSAYIRHEAHAARGLVEFIHLPASEFSQGTLDIDTQ